MQGLFFLLLTIIRQSSGKLLHAGVSEDAGEIDMENRRAQLDHCKVRYLDQRRD